MIEVPSHVKSHLARDQTFGQLIGELDPKYTRPSQGAFIDLVRIIIGQQVSVAAARSIYGRLVDQIGKQYSPEDILKQNEEDLQACGISRQKRAYIKNIARYFQDNQSTIATWHEALDNEITEALISISGVGPWTARIMLMFTYRREDIFPVKDVGIQNAIKEVYDVDLEGKELFIEMERLAEAWRPYRTYACLYLWNYLLKQRT